jgi:NADP-dependent 3-hydroxy acid dehydrogenase YdfG
MSKKLAGKVALVTGASSGIGEATAVVLAEEGARVAALARRADRLEQVVKRIKDAGGEAVSIIADMTNEVQLRTAILQAKETFGRIDILVNNAVSESLRQEVTKQHIRVTVIEPGMVATELRQHITDPEVRKAQQEAEHRITPLRGEDIAAAIVFAITLPKHVSISEMLIRPTEQV